MSRPCPLSARRDVVFLRATMDNSYSFFIPNPPEMTNQELKDLVASLAVAQVELTAKMDRLNAESTAKMDRLNVESTAKLERMGIHLGGISNNMGDVAEEFFYTALEDKKDLAGIHYDFIDKHWKHRVGSIADEFDIVMVNGSDVAIIEVKYKAHDNDLDKLLTKKYPNFKTLYPAYKDYNHHLGLASFNVNNALKEKAIQKGVIVLQRKGNLMETFVPKTIKEAKLTSSPTK